MAYGTEKSVRKTHELTLTDRGSLTLSGVEDVSGFDENLVVLTTSMGELSIQGSDLHVERIDLDVGALEVRGNVQALSYSDGTAAAPLWKRFFG